MFTLPVDRNSTLNLLAPGKQVKERTWKLTTVLQSGVCVNGGDWIAGSQKDHVISTNFTLDIVFDNVVLSSHAVTSNQTCVTNILVDTDQINKHILTFRITGKDHSQPVVDNIHSAVCLYFYIEDLLFKDCIDTLTQFKVYLTNESKMGTTIIGENGELTLELTTPIYTWLLANQASISLE